MTEGFPANWSLRSVDDCMEAIIDYRGKSPTKTNFGVPLITAKVVKGGRIDTPDEFIAVEDYDSWMRRGLPKPGDVLITTEAPLGEVAQLDGRKVALAQRLIALRGESGVLDNTYLKFVIQSAFVQDQLKARATGTTVLGIRQSELRKVLIPHPPYAVQRRIADILGSVDDKIELSRRTNETLEAMARTLFRSWFVDFDPVRAKADGEKPLGMDAATAKLFPASFEQSALGPIPKGWRADSFGSIVKLLSGGTPSKSNAAFWVGDIPWLSAKDMKTPRILDTEDHVSPEGAENGTRLVEAGTTLILVRGMTLHHDVPICMAARSLTFNQDVKAAVSDNPELREYVFLWLLDSKPTLMGLVDSASHGTGRIHTDMLAKQVMIVPPPNVLARFNAIVRPLMERATANDRESRQLAATRDALLPKLLSGEVSVSADGPLAEVR